MVKEHFCLTSGFLMPRVERPVSGKIDQLAFTFYCAVLFVVFRDAVCRMSFCETNPEKLRKLNEEAKSKSNKDLGFYPSAADAMDVWLTRTFSHKDPYHSGTFLLRYFNCV